MTATTSTLLKPAILLTNDDGISPESAFILPLARQLCDDGHDVIVCAPGGNNSACGQRITLSKTITMRRHRDFEERFAGRGSLSVFSIDQGTPCDCVIASIEPHTGLCARLTKQPHLVVSGINVGPNLGTDIFYSGTFSAARQASFYGIPSVALSLDLFTRQPNAEKHLPAVRAGLNAASAFVNKALAALPDQLPDPGRFHMREKLHDYSVARDASRNAQTRLEDAFSRGDIIFNVNIPTEWDGSFVASTLDSVLYRSIINIESVPSGIPGSKDEETEIRFSGKCYDQLRVPGSDVDVLQRTKSASVCPVSTHPVSHPLSLPDRFFAEVRKQPSAFWETAITEENVSHSQIS